MFVSWDCDEPVTLEEAKAHLRVDFTEDDTLITSLVAAAREQAENYICAPIRCRTETKTTKGFPACYHLPHLVSVESIEYGGETFSDFVVLGDMVSGDWPSTNELVEITYKAGYPLDDNEEQTVPQVIKQAMLLTVGHLYENRETVITGTISTELPMTTEALLHPYRNYLD